MSARFLILACCGVIVAPGCSAPPRTQDASASSTTAVAPEVVPPFLAGEWRQDAEIIRTDLYIWPDGHCGLIRTTSRDIEQFSCVATYDPASLTLTLNSSPSAVGETGATLIYDDSAKTLSPWKNAGSERTFKRIGPQIPSRASRVYNEFPPN